MDSQRSCRAIEASPGPGFVGWLGWLIDHRQALAVRSALPPETEVCIFVNNRLEGNSIRDCGNDAAGLAGRRAMCRFHRAIGGIEIRIVCGNTPRMVHIANEAEKLILEVEGLDKP